MAGGAEFWGFHDYRQREEIARERAGKRWAEQLDTLGGSGAAPHLPAGMLTRPELYAEELEKQLRAACMVTAQTRDAMKRATAILEEV